MPQKVILLSDVPGLGQIGDMKSVKDGYARNYLVPEHMAILASPDAIRKIERQKEKLSAQRDKQLANAKQIGDKLSQFGLEFKRPVGLGGRLFGSVTPLDVVNELGKKGASVEKKSVLMDGPIKMAGSHKVRVRVHSKVIIDIPVSVVALDEKVEGEEPVDSPKAEKETTSESPESQESKEE